MHRSPHDQRCPGQLGRAVSEPQSWALGSGLGGTQTSVSSSSQVTLWLLVGTTRWEQRLQSAVYFISYVLPQFYQQLKSPHNLKKNKKSINFQRTQPPHTDSGRVTDVVCGHCQRCDRNGELFLQEWVTRSEASYLTIKPALCLILSCGCSDVFKKFCLFILE